MSITPATRKSFAGSTCSALNRAIFGFGNTAHDLCQGPIELDHIREESGGERKDDPAHLLPFCAWHHRLSQEWRSDSTKHREAERRWLANHYPLEWVEWLERRSA